MNGRQKHKYSTNENNLAKNEDDEIGAGAG
jgi:hypothetical protein